jgi:hypothetical protein
MGRGTRNKKEIKADSRSKNRTDKFGSIEDRFERLEAQSNTDSDVEGSSNEEEEEQVYF